MMTSKTLYEILNVQPAASLAEIKTAFRRLALMYHPDTNNSREAQARLADLLQPGNASRLSIMDNMLEALSLGYHYLGCINLYIRDKTTKITPFRHTNPVYEKHPLRIADLSE